VSTLARALFAALVIATFGAFFVAQRLKSSEPRISHLGVEGLLSPNQDGRRESVKITFRLRRGDRIDVQVVDRDGDAVRELASGRDVEKGEPVVLRWDGRDDERRRARDGTYRVRLVLRREGRSIVLPRNIVLDTTPPRPRVVSIGPDRTKVPRPELLPRPDGRPAQIRFVAPGRRQSVEIWKTDGPRPRLVTGLRIEGGVSPAGEGVAYWDGTKDGRRVSPGTYVAVVRSRDRAGNIGRSVPRRVLEGRARRGEVLPGRGGITVRYLAAQSPLVPVRAGDEFTVAVDARQQTYNWQLRRVGAREPVLHSRRSRGGALTRRTRSGWESGLFLFEARTRDRRVTVPVPVDDRRDNRVLVVLPATTWQGRNEVDDDGDGLPNTLDRGVPVRLARVWAGDGLPAGVAENEAPLLARLTAQGLRYDLTTDIALANGQGPELEGHRGVLIAGDATWLTEEVRRRLRAFVARGGTLASLGTRSLRSEVRQTQRRLLDPTPVGRTDLFGARLDPVVRKPVNLTILDDDGRLQLFAGEEGLFPDVEAWEATRSVGPEARALSAAVTEDGNRPVIVAARYGEGLVIRTGIPGFATRLGSDPASAELLGRIWTLLRTG
jgi:hypothetical protein